MFISDYVFSKLFKSQTLQTFTNMAPVNLK